MGDTSKLDALFQHSRIAALIHGHLGVNFDNIRTILNSVSHFRKDTPVAIVAVTGGCSEFKAFLTNFLIQFASKGGDGSWMNDVVRRTKEGKPMLDRGFSWGSVNSKNFFRGDGGVYLWPIPYFVKERGILVWIMHMDVQESVEALENFLMLACSGVLDFKEEDDDDKIQLLERYYDLSQIGYEKDLCKSASFVIRSTGNVPRGTLTDENAKEILLKLVIDRERRKLYKNLLRRFDHVNLSWLKAEELFYNTHGVLDETVKPLLTQIKKFVAQFLDDEEIMAKTTSSGVLTLGNMEQFIRNAAEKAMPLEQGFDALLVSDTPSPGQLKRAKDELESLRMVQQILEKEGESSSSQQRVSAGGVVDNDGIPEQLKCPVCFEVYQDKVFLCVNGHALCDTCFQNIKECPECRVSLQNPTIRCRPLEGLVNGWTLDCPFKEKGCREKLVSREMTSHVEKCVWGRKSEQQVQLERLAEQIGEKEVEIRRLEISQAKQNLAQRCGEMMTKIDVGYFKIKSNLAKNLIKEKIQYAKDIAEQPTSLSMEVIAAQGEYLDKLEEKYNRKC